GPPKPERRESTLGVHRRSAVGRTREGPPLVVPLPCLDLATAAARGAEIPGCNGHRAGALVAGPSGDVGAVPRRGAAPARGARLLRVPDVLRARQPIPFG